MKDLCFSCKKWENCPVGDMSFIENIEGYVADQPDEMIKPGITLAIVKCTHFKEV